MRWEKHIAGVAGSCLGFRQAMRNEPFVTSHPSLSRKNWQWTIRVGFHADAEPFSNQDSLYTISWQSLLGSSKTMQKLFVCTVIRKSEMSADTLDYILRILASSFNTLLDGKTPSTNLLNRGFLGGGEWLANGWRGALCQIRGDWAFHCECFYCPQWNSADRSSGTGSKHLNLSIQLSLPPGGSSPPLPE